MRTPRALDFAFLSTLFAVIFLACHKRTTFIAKWTGPPQSPILRPKTLLVRGLVGREPSIDIMGPSSNPSLNRDCILFIHKGGSQIRGSEQCLLALLEAIDVTKYRPLVLCDQPVLLDKVTQLGIDAQLIELPEIMIDGSLRLPLLRYCKALINIRGIIKAHNPLLVYCNGGAPCQLAVPVCRPRKIPILCHFHHPAPKSYCYLWLLKFVEHFVFPSEYTRQHSKLKAGIDGDVIYNGVDIDRYKPDPNAGSELRCSLGLSSDNVVVGQVGALEGHKDHETLVRAFALASKNEPRLRLVIVGDGPLKGRLKELARSHGVNDKTLFTGYVKDVTPFYQQVFDIHVLASTEEGLGISLLEAASCGVVNIGSNCTGIREVIVPDETGILFKPGDELELSEAISHLSHSPEMRRKLSINGLKRVHDCFTVSRYAEQITSRIATIVARSSTYAFKKTSSRKI